MPVTESVPSLQGAIVRLRPVRADDVAPLADLLAHPAVARWWPGYDAERVRRETLHADDGTVSFVIEAEGRVAGLIQYWEETEPDYRHAGIDIALHPDWHGRGLGTDALRTLARHLFDTVGHHRIVIDPAAGNERAISVYQRVGFRPVGIMRRYERGADGTWHDGLLMDLLREDLR